jgi:hypothetical protein
MGSAEGIPGMLGQQSIGQVVPGQGVTPIGQTGPWGTQGSNLAGAAQGPGIPPPVTGADVYNVAQKGYDIYDAASQEEEPPPPIIMAPQRPSRFMRPLELPQGPSNMLTMEELLARHRNRPVQGGIRGI